MGYLILIIIVVVLLIVFLIIILKKINQHFSDSVGENIVAHILKRLNPEKYKIINNIKIYKDKEPAQIDHLIISNFGIFVIKSINFDGIIIGEETSNYWTQILYENRDIFTLRNEKKFNNPIKQNNLNVQVLQEILKKYSDILYFPIVVFTVSSDLRVKTITNVVKTGDLLKTIKQHQTETISDIARDDIYNYLRILKARTN